MSQFSQRWIQEAQTLPTPGREEGAWDRQKEAGHSQSTQMIQQQGGGEEEGKGGYGKGRGGIRGDPAEVL